MRWNGGQTEGFASTLGIIGGDNGCVDVNEIIAVEEFVERAQHGVPQSQHCALYVSASPQMRMISEILGCESLLLYGIGLKASVSVLEHQSESLMHLWVART